MSVCFNYFKNISVLMVTGGESALDRSTGEGEGGTATSTSVELLSSNGTRLCSLPNLTVQRYHHSQTGLLSCGGGGDILHPGGDMKTCETFVDGRWQKSHTLGQSRYAHTAWASPQGVLLMGGTESSSTTELLNDNGHTTPSFTVQNRRL